MIKTGDCRRLMKILEKNSISLILTDPPYFIDGMGEDWNKNHLEKRISKADVIGSLPIGMKFCPNQSKKLRKFMTPICSEWMRVIKPGGFVLCFIQPRLSHSISIALEEAGFEIRDSYIWKRLGQAKAFTHNHFIKKRKNLSKNEKEKLLKSIGSRKTAQLRPDFEMIIMAQAPTNLRLIDNWKQYKTGFIDVSNPFIDMGSFPSTIINCPKPKERHGHITPKPVPLLRHLIRIFCEPNGLILDPFLGSGSTGVAATLEKRKFIGFEINKEYAQISKERIKQHKEATKKELKKAFQNVEKTYFSN